MASKSASAKAKAALPSAPRITVECVNARCANAGKATVVDAGVMLAENVMASYSPNCTVCGFSMSVTGPAE